MVEATADPLPLGDATTINVSLVIPSIRVPRWIAAVAKDIDADPSLRARALYVDTTAPLRDTPVSFRAYEYLDALLFRRPIDALEPVCLRSELPAVPVVALPAENIHLEEEALESLRLDVILNFGSERAQQLASLATYGVWEVGQSDQAGVSSEPWLFYPMREGSIFRTSIEGSRRGSRYLLYESFGATDPVSLHRMRNLACWKAASALLNRLRLLSTAGWDTLVTHGPAPEIGESRRPRLGAATVGRHAVTVGAGVIARRIRNVFFREDWFIATRPRGSSHSLEVEPPFMPISSPSGFYFADPFPITYAGRTYVFVESYSHKRRRAAIWFLTLDSTGRPVGRPRIALERDYHLSYPFVFEHAGEVFMIPESSEHRTVELYRAIHFPDDWRLDRILFSGVRAVDATVCKGDGRLYLFLNMAGEGASLDDELHLFSAKRPVGPWRPHPANPVVADVRSSRPAGRLFRSDGRLIRPSQDSSRGYGGAIVLNQIDVLTETDYKESAVGRIEPSWMPGISRTHTFNAFDHVEVIDAARHISRLSAKMFRPASGAEE
jgi:hypothetical protein